MTEHTSPHKPKPAPQPALAPKPKSPAPIVHQATASGGQILDAKTQREMGARFGHDFSHVRIHTDTRAVESAQSLGANAYAVGNDVVFGPGRYAPGTGDGSRLLAHELTHIVQQGQLGSGDWSRMSSRGDASEREADSLASQVLAGRSVRVRTAPSAAIARDELPEVPDTPTMREKDKPGGPTDWGDKGFSLNWDRIWPPKNWLSPKSGSVDPGMGDPFTFSRPAPAAGPDLTPPVILPPPTTADPNAGMCTPNDPPQSAVPLGPGFQYTPRFGGGGGLFGQPFDPKQPYGDPKTWQPSVVPPGPF